MTIFRLILFLIVSFHISLFASYDYTIDEFIDDITNKLVKEKELNSIIEVSDLNYQEASSLTDWTFSTTLFSSHNEPFQTSSFTSNYINSTGLDFDLSRPILSTGGSLGFSMKQHRIHQQNIEFNGAELNQPLYYQNTIGISYTQPILYGFLGDLYELPIVTASTNTKQVKLNATDEYEQFLLEELFIFIDWTLSNELTELSFSRLQLAKESLKQTKKRVKVNLSEKIDLLRAEYALQSSFQNWKTYQARLKSAQFKIATRFDDVSLRQKTPRFDLYEFSYTKKPDYIVIEKLRSIRSLNLNESILKKQLALSESKRNGSLNIIGSYEFLGGNNNFTSATKYLKNNSSIAFQYSRHLSDVESIADVKEKKETMVQFELKRERLIRELQSEIVALHTLINEYKTILDINLNQIAISQSKATAEQKLYRQGRTSIDMLIQAQDNVLTSKTNYAQLSAEYQKYTITYLALTDELLSTYKLSL